MRKMDILGLYDAMSDNAADKLDALSAGEAGTYAGEDGLPRCAACREPRQCRVRLPEALGGEWRTHRIACRCEQAVLDAERDAERRRSRLEHIARLRRESAMDGRMLASTFERFDADERNERVRRICARYVEIFDRFERTNQGLLLYGPPGTGKTFAAACIANALIDRGKAVWMTSFVAILRTAYQGGEAWDALIARVATAPLVIIDDLGAQRDTNTAIEHVYGVIDDRYRADRPVIYTTNLTPQAMKNPDDIRAARMYDRVLENCYPVLTDGPSRRRREAARRFEEMKNVLV